MGAHQSAEQIAALKANATISDLVRKLSPPSTLISTAESLAKQEASSTENKSCDAKQIFDRYIDPDTELPFLHHIVYGENIDDETYSVNVVNELITQGLIDNLNAKMEGTDLTPIHLACARNIFRRSDVDAKELMKNPTPPPPTQTDKNNMVLFLLTEGVDVDAVDQHGRTPLMYAARSLNLLAMKELVGQGASANVSDKLERNVFHHFALAYGVNKEALYSLSTSAIIDTLSAVIAVSSNSTRDATIIMYRCSFDGDPFLAHCSWEEYTLATHDYCRNIREAAHKEKYKGVPEEEVPKFRDNTLYRVFAEPSIGFFKTQGRTFGGKSVTVVDFHAFRCSAFHILLYAFYRFHSGMGGEEAVFAFPAIMKLFLQNGFDFYTKQAFKNTGFKYEDWRTYDVFSKRAYKLEFRYKFERAMAEEWNECSFLSSLHPEDGLLFFQNHKKDPSDLAIPFRDEAELPRSAFDSRLVQSDVALAQMALESSLAASIVLAHYGIFSLLIDRYGFGALVSPIGNFGITPLHLLLGIKIENNRPAQTYFVDRAIEIAFQVAKKDGYFNDESKLFTALAKVITPFDLREDAQAFIKCLGDNYMKTGEKVFNASSKPEDLDFTQTSLTPLISCLANEVRPVTLNHLLPHCSDMKAAFFDNKLAREAVTDLTVNNETPEWVWESIIFKYFPKIVHLKISGDLNTMDEDWDLLFFGNENEDEDDETTSTTPIPAFETIDIRDCLLPQDFFQMISDSPRLLGSLKKLELHYDCEINGFDEMKKFVRETNFTNPLCEVILYGGQNELEICQELNQIRSEVDQVKDGSWNTLTFVHRSKDTPLL